ncbi:hypothetical protein B0I31_101345 [Saccharothrix carnea]|uniref:Uncharacterized protein n=1 Tax=Saccharothrix carnea TaxID=1280637 RepID=A0A2P8II62_SACCR|nr:hypothetical protein [Saccharothrix carnea]PSL58129.1 hypothetical protein B0I31_101345 [Saccharothrix carnea]
MRQLLVMLVLLLAAPGVASAAGALHSCTTSVEGKAASGGCEGRGSFRLVASCADGTTVDSSWFTISNGRAWTKIRCRSAVVDAWIEQR